MGHQINLTGWGGLAETECSGNGTCTGVGNALLLTIIGLIVRKDPNFDFASMTRRDYEQVMRGIFVEFDSTMGTASPDLYDFKLAGGKMLTHYGLVSRLASCGCKADVFVA